MLGAIIGDIVGSTREWGNVKTEDFELLPSGSRFTDDTVMTLAVAKWLMDDPAHQPDSLVRIMQEMGRKYPDAGYGGMFNKWLKSDNPQPYGSYGNGSGMRVSPVGLYANSLDEALELAKITASVSHNHPEGIKGAQAIAACVFMVKSNQYRKDEIEHYVTEHFGYNLNVKLEDIRDTYHFDVTCQGSVPIAIMAFLQRHNARDVLRLAISMGGDSDTIGCMATAIADAKPFWSISRTDFPDDVVEKCRAILTPELLAINDRFEAFVSRPLNQSFYLEGHVFCGEYPGDKNESTARAKIVQMTHFGVRHFIDLTEEGELRPYAHLLPEGTTYKRFPIHDCDVPGSILDVEKLVDHIHNLSNNDNGLVYIHCWGGVGRTGTIAACYLAWNNSRLNSFETVMEQLRDRFSQMPKSAHRIIPDTKSQEMFINKYIQGMEQRKKERIERINDKIRGCLMAGAAGDALGYPVEFMSRGAILTQYGDKGITRLMADSDDKALVSDDTQMTLFTANGILMGITRGAMRGIGGNPEGYVQYAYLDWYYTQSGHKADTKYTWLRDLPRLAHRRAPGNTCLSACDSMFRHENVNNNSKGCGGIMRVAPMGLLTASYESKGLNTYDEARTAWAGGEIARCTHRHPLGFLPAALLTHVVHRLTLLTTEDGIAQFRQIVSHATELLNDIYQGEYERDKQFLTALTNRALELAGDTSLPDHEAIAQLGEGWVGDEAWAIAVYCAARHLNDPAQAVIAAVNHNGDSDSTGAVTGNIVGALYGLNALEERHFLCPGGRTLTDTVELADIILALADDLSTGCIVSEYGRNDTPEQKQWLARYCKMEPAGLGKKAPKAYRRSFTPGKISSLKPNEIFVFGSNLAGSHGGGAAYAAWKHFGAVMGQGVGLQGQSYAIPTMQGGVETIKPYVDEFIAFARSHPELTFWVTRIGCGIAGFADSDMAPLFRDSLPLENVLLPRSFVEILNAL